MSQRLDDYVIEAEIDRSKVTPKEAWKEVKYHRERLKDSKSYQAALNLQAAFRHYMLTLRFEIVE